MSLDDSRDLIVLARRGGARSFALDRSATGLQTAAAAARRPASARAGVAGPGRSGTTPRSQSGRSVNPNQRSPAFSSSAGIPGPKLLTPTPGGVQRPLRPGSAASVSRPYRSKDSGDDPLHVIKEKLEILVENHQDLDFCEKPFFRPALWEATWKNHEDIVRLLAERRASVSVADYQGRTPLHEAAYYGHNRLVEFLLDRGHPIDCLDTFGQTPLFRAVEAGRHAAVERLVARRAEVGLLDKDGVTVQHVAAFRGRPQLSEWLLYQGAFKHRLAVEDDDRPSLPLSARAPKEAAPPPVPARRPPRPELPSGGPLVPLSLRQEAVVATTVPERQTGSLLPADHRPRRSSVLRGASAGP